MWTWMRHPETAGLNRFPDGVVEQMTALGWERYEPPTPDSGPHFDALVEPAPIPEPQVDQLPANPKARAQRPTPGVTDG